MKLPGMWTLRQLSSRAKHVAADGAHQCGEQMVEQMTHIVDPCPYMTGKVDTIHAEFVLCCLQDVQGPGPRATICRKMKYWSRRSRAMDQSLILPDYCDGMKSLAISLAANKSAATDWLVRPSEM